MQLNTSFTQHFNNNMSVKCEICHREFQKQITNSHLKSHDITTAAYKILYGDSSLSSPEYKNQLSKTRSGIFNPNFGNKMSDDSKKLISEKRKGIIPWNKGLTHEDTSIQRMAAQKRESRYQSGQLVRKVNIPSQETKKKISIGVKKYAISNASDIVRRSLLSVETKKKKNIDLAFFRGKKHSTETKKKIAFKSKTTNKLKIAKSNEYRKKLIDSADFTLLKSVNNLLHLRCNKCSHLLIITKQYFTDSKFIKEKCRVCFPGVAHRSLKEIALFNVVKELASDAINNYRFSSSRHELDIYIPSMNIGIEFNGLYWHCDSLLSKHSDFEKYKKITAMGIKCIVIMEDEWDLKKDIVIDRLKTILKKQTRKIYARNCECREISSREAAEFCKKFHIQSSGRSNVRFGLFNNQELISVMTFSKSNISRKITNWELNRFCSISNTLVVGAASKLLTAFKRNYNPEQIVTYADRRWSAGNLYEKLGFNFVSNTRPGYWYFLPNEVKRIHRFNLRKNSSDDQSLTEYQNRLNQGYLRIWDCGNTKWIWKRDP